jgi:hypothetical protein
MNADAWFSPATDRVIAVLSNFDRPASERAMTWRVNRLPK